VLIALALLVVITGTLYTTYFTIMRGRDAAISGMETRRALAGTLEMLRKELAASFYRRGNGALSFIVEDKDIFGKPASTLTFSTVGPGGQPDGYGDLIRVSYQPAGKKDAMDLTRSERDPYRGVEEPVRYPQMEGIDSFLVECLDNGKWVRTWNTDLKPALPEAVRVTILTRDGGKTSEYTASVKLRITGS
jgi:general secretion pathway protein J